MSNEKKDVIIPTVKVAKGDCVAKINVSDLPQWKRQGFEVVKDEKKADK